MNKTMIGIVAFVIIAGGGYVYFTNSPSTNEQATMEEKEGESMMHEEGAFSGSLQELAARGGDYKCTIQHDSDVASSQGVVYISGDRVRGDFQSEAQGISVASHLIVKEGYTYTWSPLTPTGFKARAVAEASGDGDAAMQGSYADFQQAYNYNCEHWSVDESQFELPGVTFVDIN